MQKDKLKFYFVIASLIILALIPIVLFFFADINPTPSGCKISSVMHMESDSQWVDECISNLALRNKDLKLCFDASSKTNCILSYLKNEEVSSLENCEILRPFNDQFTSLTDTCYKKLALKMQDPEICKKIDDATPLTGTRQFCYQELAISLNNKTICKYINNNEETVISYAVRLCESKVIYPK